MEISVWLAFALAATIIVAVPGPTIILVLVQSVRHGPRAAMPLVAGVAIGDCLAVTGSLLGLGVILATSAVLFSILKWLGAAYLIYMGWQMWRRPPELSGGSPSGLSPGETDSSESASGEGPLPSARLFRHACTVTALNPKGIIFFMAFVPQFVDPGADTSMQLLIMAITFVVLGALNAAIYALFAGRLRLWLQRPAARLWFQRGGGAALMGAGMITAMTER